MVVVFRCVRIPLPFPSNFSLFILPLFIFSLLSVSFFILSYFASFIFPGLLIAYRLLPFVFLFLVPFFIPFLCNHSHFLLSHVHPFSSLKWMGRIWLHCLFCSGD